MDLSAKRILLTGADGFVGRALGERLRNAGAAVFAARGPGALGGVDLSVDAQRVVREADPEIVVHLAGLSSVGSSLNDPSALWDNVRMTDALARALRGRGRPVRLLFASTAEVYGASFNAGVVDEDSALVPLNAYGRSKVACEYLLRDAASDALRVTALRLFNHSGPGQSDRFVLPSLARQIARLEAGLEPGPLRHGNMDVARDFSDIEDVLDAYVAVIADEGAQPFSVFNVGTGQPVALQAVLELFLSLAHVPIATAADPARMRPAEVPVAAGRVDRFRERYKIRFRRSLRDLLARLLEAERSALA